MTSGYSEVSDVLSVEAYFDKPFMAYFFVYQSDDSLSDNEITPNFFVPNNFQSFYFAWFSYVVELS